MSSIRLVEFVRSFHIGGTEGQLVELLRGLPPRYQIQVAVTHDAGPLLEDVWRLGHLPCEFSFHGSVKKPNTALQILRLAFWLRQQRAQVLHAHDFYTALLAVPAARLAGVKLVVGRLDLAHFHTKAQRRALVACSMAADRVVANAEAIRRMLIDVEGIPAGRIEVIRNGIDLPRFDRKMKEPLGAPLPEVGEEPVVAHVANMAHPVKRQEDLLWALVHLKAKGRRLHAFLIGNGPRRPELEALAGGLGVADQVHFLGHRQDVPAILGRVQLGVICSSAEGLSNAVIEGMAARLPMVVTAVGGSPELVTDGVRGRVVPPQEPQALACALGELLDAPGRARQMGERARDFVERELTLEQLCRRHDALYRKVAQGPWQQPARPAHPGQEEAGCPSS